jgi:hypothetical protein
MSTTTTSLKTIEHKKGEEAKGERYKGYKIRRKRKKTFDLQII